MMYENNRLLQNQYQHTFSPALINRVGGNTSAQKAKNYSKPSFNLQLAYIEGKIYNTSIHIIQTT